ncbi:MAG: M1 family aminopeptidase [Planctomycetota bacterium]|jgi:hypothetical protein
MAPLILLLLDAWQVTYAQGLIDRLHSYDILAYEVAVEPGRDGLAVDCTLSVRVERPGPLRFLLASDVGGLTVTHAGKPVAATLGTGGFEAVLRLFAGDVQGVPSLLTVKLAAPPAPGDEVTLRLRYTWRPPREGWSYAEQDAVQTHLSPFWLPTMADEMFRAHVSVRTRAQAFAPGEREAEEGGWRFQSTHPLQVVPLVVGRFEEHRRVVGDRTLALHLPAGVEAEPEPLLDDLQQVLGRLEAWFGPGPGRAVHLIVEARNRPLPSYCGGPFVVVDRRFLALERARWLAHLAHECAHIWWGHRVATTVVGRGGTWLREGLAEWSGIKVAGALLGARTESALWRARLKAYLSRSDLRRTSAGLLFANEVSLKDASYLDDPAVPYWRGALVLRLLEHRRGAEAFRTSLHGWAHAHADAFARLEDFVAAVDEAAAIDYYARTTRLPDLELADLVVAGSRLTATVRCADPAWPGGEVAVSIETRGGVEVVAVTVRDGQGALRWEGQEPPLRVDIDPERIHLDPVRSNNVWSPD